MSQNPSKRAINRQRWQAQITAWEQSELTQQAFCQQHQITLASFQRWRKIFTAEQSKNSENKKPVKFLPVTIKPQDREKLTLVFHDQLRLEIPQCFDINRLSQIVSLLRQ